MHSILIVLYHDVNAILDVLGVKVIASRRSTEVK